MNFRTEGSGRSPDKFYQAAQKRPSAALSGRLTISAAWQQSLLIRRDATLRISGALRLGIFEQPEKVYFFPGTASPEEEVAKV
jgi:hypothetical protein